MYLGSLEVKRKAQKKRSFVLMCRRVRYEARVRVGVPVVLLVVYDGR